MDKVISDGADPNSSDRFGQTVLHEVDTSFTFSFFLTVLFGVTTFTFNIIMDTKVQKCGLCSRAAESGPMFALLVRDETLSEKVTNFVFMLNVGG